jgi:mersacidin/lichenicidin family type 2 lantibiotic
MDVPDGMDVKVVENADNCVHITMPAPPTGFKELSDEELSNAAGGTLTSLLLIDCVLAVATVT